jgi:hypothetical protein
MAHVEEECEWLAVLVKELSRLQGLALAGREIDRQLGLANYLKDRIRERDGFELVVQVYKHMMGRVLTHLKSAGSAVHKCVFLVHPAMSERSGRE